MIGKEKKNTFEVWYSGEYGLGVMYKRAKDAKECRATLPRYVKAGLVSVKKVTRGNRKSIAK